MSRLRPGAPVPVGQGDVLNPFVEGWLARVAGEGPVLDLGCGNGFWTLRMMAAGHAVVGVEPHYGEVAELARASTAPARVAVADGAAIPLADGSCSLVWCIHVLHHLDDPPAVLAEVRRVLRPGGHLVLAETVEDNPVIRVGRRLHPTWDGVEIKARFTASTLLGLVAEAGLDVVDERQHSLVSFAAWALPGARRRAWGWLSRAEERLPAWTRRFGAHVELVARPAPVAAAA